jgi:hypothetical protein
VLTTEHKAAAILVAASELRSPNNTDLTSAALMPSPRGRKPSLRPKESSMSWACSASLSKGAFPGGKPLPQIARSWAPTCSDRLRYPAGSRFNHEFFVRYTMQGVSPLDDRVPTKRGFSQQQRAF